ncbi:MAG: hypothetical protein K2K56_13660 [Lachnospiraceae bacterium]|nr:hypothetical protein [Lachnospiraceae bacterium]
MAIGFYSNSYDVKEYTIKNQDGSVAGTIRIKKPVKKKTKRLNYNFKYISNKIFMSKTSDSAGRALATAQVNIGALHRKLKTGQFDEKEVELAIIHAKKLERVARKKLKHLQEEENAKQRGSCQDNTDENGVSGLEDSKKDSKEEKVPEISEEELRKLTKELQKLMEETMKETMEQTADELMGSIHRDMDDDDLELLKKKHRAKELREILEADMKYLKAFFNKLQKEKEEASKGQCSSEGVSLEISGVEMPVQTSEAPIIAEGGGIDLSI